MKLDIDLDDLENYITISDEKLNHIKKELIKYLRQYDVFDMIQICVYKTDNNYILEIFDDTNHPHKRFIVKVDYERNMIGVGCMMFEKLDPIVLQKYKMKNMGKTLPIKINDQHNLIYYNDKFGIEDINTGHKDELSWVHEYTTSNGEKIDISSNWYDVGIRENERIDYDYTIEISESKFIIYENKDWISIINIIADDYHYWDIKYYLIDIMNKKCMDLNLHDHNYAFNCDIPSIWIENDCLKCFQHCIDGGLVIKNLYNIVDDIPRHLNHDISLYHDSEKMGESLLELDVKKYFDIDNFIEDWKKC